MNSRYLDSKDTSYWVCKFINECILTFILSCFTYYIQILKWYDEKYHQKCLKLNYNILLFSKLNTVSCESERLNVENGINFFSRFLLWMTGRKTLLNLYVLLKKVRRSPVHVSEAKLISDFENYRLVNKNRRQNELLFSSSLKSELIRVFRHYRNVH